MATITGTPGDDSSLLGGQDLIGTSVADQISGLAGRDSLDGQAGNDTLLGGEGNDGLRGGTGNDTLDGGEGIDQVREAGDFNFTLTNNKLVGNGTDTLISIESVVLGGGVGNNRLDASALTAGSVVFDGGAGNDTLLGGSGTDLLIGGLGNNVINGGAGIDRIQADAGDGNITLTNNTLTTNGGAGVDTFTEIELASLFGRNGNNLLDASTFQGSVAFFGGLGNDTLLGGSAADSFTANAGNDSLNGGAGIDRVVETGSNFTLSNNSLLGNGTDTLVSIETAILTGNASNNIINAANPFLGMFTNGSVTFNGEAGDDTLIGGTSNDTLNGGLGIDQVQASGDVNFTLTNSSLTGAGTDTLSSIESASLTGSGDNNFMDARDFTQGSVTLKGGGGEDFVIGGTGDDSLLGQDGDDVLGGNAGNDLIDGGAGNDRLIEDGSSFTLTNDRLFGSDGTDTLASIETVSLSAFSDGGVIDASGFTNGSVSLQSQIGSSVLVGGTRDDTLEGGLSSDVDLLFGGNGNDFLSGGSGNDELDGGLGNDRLRGGFGESIGAGNIEFDTLLGGFDADTFLFGDGFAPFYLGTGHGTIADFAIADGDKIELFGSLGNHQFSLGSADGDGALDTFIQFGSDLICVVEDVNVIDADVFTFVPLSPIP